MVLNFIVLAQTKNFILKPIAWVLSKLINLIFTGVYSMTVSHSMAISIILFTFIIRAIMVPMTLKQQRSSRKMQRLQPQIAKIQDKYKGKTDPESRQRMSVEMQEIYSKNKTSPFTGCLPMLIQMPILFAMYEVLRNLPFYMNELGDIYTKMANTVMATNGYADVISESFSSVLKSISKFDAAKVNSIIDFLGHLSRTQWVEFMEATGLNSDAAFTALQVKQASINSFIGFNLSEAPGWGFPGIIWPLLAGGTTWLQTWLMQRANDKRQKLVGRVADEQKQQQQTMKMMNIFFPIMMGFIVVSTPLGLGLYWVVSNIFSLIQQVILDKIIDREEYREALRRRDEFEEKKRLKEIAKSSIDKRTGKRIGTAQDAINKSAMAGNKQAAIRKELEARQKDAEEKIQESASNDEEV